MVELIKQICVSLTGSCLVMCDAGGRLFFPLCKQSQFIVSAPAHRLCTSLQVTPLLRAERAHIEIFTRIWADSFLEPLFRYILDVLNYVEVEARKLTAQKKSRHGGNTMTGPLSESILS